MPSIRKLTVEEATKLANKGKGKRKLTQAEYDQFLADFTSGEFGEAQLEPGENRLTVRNRLKAAAARRNLGIVFRRTRGETIRFKLEEPGQKQGLLGRVASAVTDVVSSILPKVGEPAPVAVETPPARKPGRPKKTDAVASNPMEPVPALETPAPKKPGRKKAVA